VATIEAAVKFCPFCWEEENIGYHTLVGTGGIATTFQVGCLRCRAHGPQAKTIDEAVGLWNRAKRKPKGRKVHHLGVELKLVK